MSFYTKLIAETLGVTATDDTRQMLDEIEDLMRNVIFHSTLDWQSREQFQQGAREAKEVYDYMRSPEGQRYMAELSAGA